MREVKKGHIDDLAERDAVWSRKLQEMEEQWHWEMAKRKVDKIESATNDNTLD
ncbi:hypothetical protein [Dyadobacter tibetensis]|uniref:hypothetical protein n=1 Tax=Dyadobacter tibetensis TaxID=1211851 RepID=UPI0004BC0216|nr:hypothetical protein [Dyadobacter tibetensis]